MTRRIAVTLGDPRGVGPELISAVLRDPPYGADIVVVGPDNLLDHLSEFGIGVGDWNENGGELEAGRLTGRAIEKAVELTTKGEVDAITTAPASKKALNAAGYKYPGHTEMLADLVGGRDTVMMMVSERLRLSLVTTHIPLSEVVEHVTKEKIVHCAERTRRALVDWWDIKNPHLALCALNPHAGEEGLMGTEDEEILAPAAEECGLVGPLPADTVFVKAMRGEYDAVITPYHDLGMTAIKVASFGKAVNVTLGLPFVRTSPDHGTAFDIARTGRVDPGSMIAAVELAFRLSG